MENGAEALMMTFGVLVLIIALSVAMISFSNAKSAADSILYTKDETNYYEYIGAKGKANQNRIVGLETIIPTLYKYYKENYTVVFKEANYNQDHEGGFTNEKYMTVYTTPQYTNGTSGTDRKANWTASYKNLMHRKYDIDQPSLNIFSFDLDEETLRHEPWTGSYEKIHKNLDLFLGGGNLINLITNTGYYIKYPDGGFIKRCTQGNYKFVETIKEYYYDGVNSESNKDNYQTQITSKTSKTKSKRMIIFTRILNNDYEEGM